MGGAQVVLGCRGKTMESVLQCKMDWKEWRALVLIVFENMRRYCLIGSCDILDSHPAVGCFIIWCVDGRPSHNECGINCKKGLTTEQKERLARKMAEKVWLLYVRNLT